MDFVRAFERVSQEGIWEIMIMFNISEGLYKYIESLYVSTDCAVLQHSELSELCHASIILCVSQGFLLSPIIVKFFLQHIMNETPDTAVNINKTEPSTILALQTIST